MKVCLSQCSIGRSLEASGVSMMWPWGALPLRPPPHEAVGTCRVAWDALPLLPQAISASYFFEEKGASGAFFCLATQPRANCRRPIGCLSPSLERQTRARGKAPDRPLARQHLSGFSPGPENPHGASNLGKARPDKPGRAGSDRQFHRLCHQFALVAHRPDASRLSKADSPGPHST